MTLDPFGAHALLETSSGPAVYYRLEVLEKAGLLTLERLPFSIRVLLEAALRQVDGQQITEDDVVALAGWRRTSTSRPDVPFRPARVIM